jgi:DNA-binding LacI/PurR family transcriptional regulator/signal transduction histidine kinase
MYYYLKSGPVLKDRYVFGFLDENRENDYHNQILYGISEAARELGIQVIRFGYYSSHIAYKFTHQADMILDHIQQYDLDGLLFLGWTQAAAMYNRENFLERFRDMPLLSIGTGFSEIPSVYFPGDVAIYNLTRHLIDEHHYSKIAYIEHYREDNRREAYEIAMRESGIYDPSLYIGNDLLPPESDLMGRIKKAVDIMLSNGAQAAISLTYSDTIFLIRELNERGISIPNELAVVSYEEGDFAKYSIPSCTTAYFPWRELGYEGCMTLARLLKTGSCPREVLMEDKVRLIYRESCGCLPYYIRLADVESIKPAEYGPDAITPAGKDAIIRKLENLYAGSGIPFKNIVDSFIRSCARRDSEIFLAEMDALLRDSGEVSGINRLVDDIRYLFYPYLISDADTLLWSGDLFLRTQAVVSKYESAVSGSAALRNKANDQVLQNATQQLFLQFSLEHLLDTLEKNMKLFRIDRCHIFISNSILTGSNVEEDLFDSSVLIFRYCNGERKETSSRADSLKRQLAAIQAEELGNVSLAYLLHVTDEIMGFALFGMEDGTPDEMLFQSLATSISTALHGIVLLNRLDATYKKLVEHAQREGMADIASNILHSIGNILNSINVSVHMMGECANSPVIDDVARAGSLMQQNLDRLEEFICTDGKGKKLMEFYLRLGSPAEKLRSQILSILDRLRTKVRTINEAIAAQQSYAGVDTRLEELLIAPIVDDALKLNEDDFEKLQITVEKEYMAGFKAQVHRAKLFFVIFHIISNAKDALVNSDNRERKLAVRLYEDETGRYLRIKDNGKGIPTAILGSLFEYGFSTKEGRYGYGLHSCAAYMADMGGSIRAESEGINKGASFILKFQ